MRLMQLALLFTPVILMTGCPSSNRVDSADAGSALTAFVSVPPQAYFVERIGGDRVKVNMLVRPGQEPHTYEPSPAQMKALAHAQVLFGIGMSFEEGLTARIRASMPSLSVVDTREGIALRDVNGHRSAEAAESSERDPHIWLAPRLVITQAHTIADELTRLDPAGTQLYEDNRAKFARELLDLQAEIAEIMRPVSGRKMVVFHPSFGYFADAFGLTQVAIEIEGKEPGPRELEQMIRRARDENVKSIFVEPQYSTAAARAVAREVDAKLVVLDPLSEDYAANMLTMARAISDALR